MRVFTLDTKIKECLPALNLVLCFLIFFIIAHSLVIGSETLLFIAIILSLVYCAIAKIGNCFLLMCGISMFESAFTIQGSNAWFALLVILVIRIIYKSNFKFKSFAFAGCLFLFALELLLDFFNGSMGQLLVNLVVVVFVFCIFSNLDKIDVKPFSITCSLSLSFLCVLYYLISMYGGIDKFISVFMTSNDAYRFGLEYGGSVGGSMAIPLYSAMIISCGLVYLIVEKSKHFFQMLFVAASSFIAMFFGAITISRSFFLCMIVLLMFLLVFKGKNSGSTRNKFILITIIVFSLLIFSQLDIFDKIFVDLGSRLNYEISPESGGRLSIWLACFDFLFSNPICLIFGIGATNYMNIALEYNLGFSAGAHNLLLDLIMSWGIVGAALIVCLCVFGLKRVLSPKCQRLMHAFLPLLVYLTFSMTALRCNNLKTWIFLLVAFFFVKKYNTREDLL
ncbi:MAG: O-antigen ligase family protein [Clostridia bacterium]|nr:O-antigen ligase family protein [Clostridia bacterium]